MGFALLFAMGAIGLGMGVSADFSRLRSPGLRPPAGTGWAGEQLAEDDHMRTAAFGNGSFAVVGLDGGWYSTNDGKSFGDLLRFRTYLEWRARKHGV